VTTKEVSPVTGPRVLLSILIPILGALVFSFIAVRQVTLNPADRGLIAIQSTGAALTSWYLGLRWYGLAGLGLRGGRPLYAGIGFAALGWLAFLIVRFITIEIAAIGSPDAGIMFVFLLLFEAFCVQLWVFGLFFRAVAGWRGPLTGAVASGILFAAVGFILFQESDYASISGLIFFTLWGIFYGIIRLRTGSLLGIVIVQALQSWTAWHIMAPESPINSNEIRNFYLIMSVLYLIFIWRLWPKRAGDYRL
jgi:hypothetical protein